MHHFTAPTTGHEASAVTTMAATTASTTHEPGPGHHPDAPSDPGHHLQHMCWAVLFSVVMLFLLALLLMTAWRDTTSAPRPPPYTRRSARPPGQSGRAVLTSVCVLRL